MVKDIPFYVEIDKLRHKIIAWNKDNGNRHEIAKLNDCLCCSQWWLEVMDKNIKKEELEDAK